MGSYNSINFTKLIVNGIPYNKAYMGSKILFNNWKPFTIEALKDNVKVTFRVSKGGMVPNKYYATIKNYNPNDSTATKRLTSSTGNDNDKSITITLSKGQKIHPQCVYNISNPWEPYYEYEGASPYRLYVYITISYILQNQNIVKIYGDITTWNAGWFYGMFNSDYITDVTELIMPTSIQHPYEFYGMFYNTKITDLTLKITDFSQDYCCYHLLPPNSGNSILHLPSGHNYPSTNTAWLPTNWTIETITTDYSQEYFTIKSLEDNNTITFTKYIQNNNYITADKPIKYSKDLITWSDISFVTDNSSQIVLNSGEKLYLKGNNSAYGEKYYNNSYLSAADIISSGNIDVMGNIMSLVYGDNFINKKTIEPYTFPSLFYNNNKLVNAKDLILPAITATRECYELMFNGCTSLVTAPELPATTLALQCYNAMFSGCTSLVTAPELPATTLADYCYFRMFRNCSSLNYVKAMFYFKEGESFNNIHVQDWLYGVSATGTFVKNSEATWSNSEWGIPTGWTVTTASE